MAAVCGFAAALPGCGGGPKMAPVTGRVSYPDGSPVVAGKVLLVPDDPTAPSAVAELEPDGSFAAFTDRPGDGARLGTYKVSVQPPGDDYSAKNPRPIDLKYEDPATSGFTVTVEDKPNTLDLTVTRPGQKAKG